MNTDTITQLRHALSLAGAPDRRLLALCDDAEAGSPDALVAIAKFCGPSLAAAQQRERVTTRYRCGLCGRPAWNQVCLTCAPDQHPSPLDPIETAYRLTVAAQMHRRFRPSCAPPCPLCLEGERDRAEMAAATGARSA